MQNCRSQEVCQALGIAGRASKACLPCVLVAGWRVTSSAGALSSFLCSYFCVFLSAHLTMSQTQFSVAALVIMSCAGSWDLFLCSVYRNHAAYGIFLVGLSFSDACILARMTETSLWSAKWGLSHLFPLKNMVSFVLSQTQFCTKTDVFKLGDQFWIGDRTCFFFRQK